MRKAYAVAFESCLSAEKLENAGAATDLAPAVHVQSHIQVF